MVDFTKPQGETPYTHPQTPGTAESGLSVGNLLLGILAGLVVSVLGAFIWASIGYYLEFFPVILIIAIALCVGFSINLLGQTSNPVAGVAGALLSVFVWFLGSIFFVILDNFDGDFLYSLQVLMDVTIWPDAIGSYIFDYNEDLDLVFDVVFVVVAAIIGFLSSLNSLGTVAKTEDAGNP